jgi:MFS transporter, ACS family, glucarate transporter
MYVPRRHLLVLGTFCLSVLLYVDRVGISAAEASVVRDLAPTGRQMGWVLSAFALGYALCQAPAGWLADCFGPRVILTLVVVVWSTFTRLTALASGLTMLLLVRFLFGGGEAGAFPGMARAAYSWIPMQECGLVQGINFYGSRVGAALALPVLATSIEVYGWRVTFVAMMVVGFAWATFWYSWFRDDPAEATTIGSLELAHILAHRQAGRHSVGGVMVRLSWRSVLRLANVWLLYLQYFCSNIS